MLRVEKKVAKERMREGGRRGGKKSKKGVGNGSPPLEEKGRATGRAAKQVGVSRKTFERVEKMKKKDPKLAKSMLTGKISIAGAAARAKVTPPAIRATAY